MRAKAKLILRYELLDPNNKPLGSFEAVEEWHGVTRLTCGSGPLSGSEILALVDTPKAGTCGLTIVKASGAVMMAFEPSPAG